MFAIQRVFTTNNTYFGPVQCSLLPELAFLMFAIERVFTTQKTGNFNFVRYCQSVRYCKSRYSQSILYCFIHSKGSALNLKINKNLANLVIFSISNMKSEMALLFQVSGKSIKKNSISNDKIIIL